MHNLFATYTNSDDGIHLLCRHPECNLDVLAGYFPPVDHMKIVQDAHRANPTARVRMP